MRLPTNGSRAVTAVVAALIAVLVPAPAQAHGAPQNPISRVLACGPDGGARSRTPACVAALAAGADVTDWDNIRMANVAGRDRQLVPDGQLCSGGLARYHGLDLARADWPATTLTPGATYTFSYRSSIPHAGSFRMYVTTDAYDPTRPLRWSDVESQPFLTVANPSFAGGAYAMTGRLPSGKTGRHVIYTIWQNTSTPDTYYSCSDVVFTGPPPAPSSPGKSTPDSGASLAGAGPGSGAGPSDERPGPSPVAIGAFVLAGLVVGAAGLRFWRRRP